MMYFILVSYHLLGEIELYPTGLPLRVISCAPGQETGGTPAALWRFAPEAVRIVFFFCWGHTWQWKIQMFRVTQSVIYKLWLSPCHVWCTKGYPELNHALHRQLVQPWDSWQAMRMSAATPTSDRIHPNLGVFERWVFPQFTAICIGKIWENDEAANLRLSGYPAIPFSR